MGAMPLGSHIDDSLVYVVHILSLFCDSAPPRLCVKISDFRRRRHHRSYMPTGIGSKADAHLLECRLCVREPYSAILFFRAQRRRWYRITSHWGSARTPGRTLAAWYSERSAPSHQPALSSRCLSTSYTSTRARRSLLAFRFGCSCPVPRRTAGAGPGRCSRACAPPRGARWR